MDEYKCTKDLFMDSGGARRFTTGKTYSFIDNRYTAFVNDLGREHNITSKWMKYFDKIEKMEDEVEFRKVEVTGDHYFVKLPVEGGFIYYAWNQEEGKCHPQGTFVPKETIFKRLRYDS